MSFIYFLIYSKETLFNPFIVGFPSESVVEDLTECLTKIANRLTESKNLFSMISFMKKMVPSTMLSELTLYSFGGLRLIDLDDIEGTFLGTNPSTPIQVYFSRVSSAEPPLPDIKDQINPKAFSNYVESHFIHTQEDEEYDRHFGPTINAGEQMAANRRRIATLEICIHDFWGTLRRLFLILLVNVGRFLGLTLFLGGYQSWLRFKLVVVVMLVYLFFKYLYPVVIGQRVNNLINSMLVYLGVIVAPFNEPNNPEEAVPQPVDTPLRRAAMSIVSHLSMVLGVIFSFFATLIPNEILILQRNHPAPVALARQQQPANVHRPPAQREEEN